MDVSKVYDYEQNYICSCEESYLCSNWIITKQTEEITELKNLVKELTTLLAKLKTSEQKVTNSERKPCTSEESISVSISNNIALTLLLLHHHQIFLLLMIKLQLSHPIYMRKRKGQEKTKSNHSQCRLINIWRWSRKKKENIDNVSSISQQYLDVSPSITKAFHFGKCDEKPRLLKITVSSESEKISIVNKISKLHNTDNSEHINNIFISSDLAPKEQETNKTLHLHLKELNKNEKRYQVKNGKIVQRQV